MKKPLFLIGAATLILSCNQQAKQNPELQTKSAEIFEAQEDNTQYGVSKNSNPSGLNVGEKVPDVKMVTVDLKEVFLKDLYKEQPLVVLFYRGYWCPACNKHLSDFAERTKELEEAGVKIIAVTPETHSNIEKTVYDTGIDFMVISDSDGSVMKAFDVDFDVTKEYQEKIEKNYGTSISETNSSNKAVLPIPATFIIDVDGTVVYKQFDPDYTNRASVDEILQNLPE